MARTLLTFWRRRLWTPSRPRRLPAAAVGQLPPALRRYRPLVELLEDRLPPNNLLGGTSLPFGLSAPASDPGQPAVVSLDSSGTGTGSGSGSGSGSSAESLATSSTGDGGGSGSGVGSGSGSGSDSSSGSGNGGGGGGGGNSVGSPPVAPAPVLLPPMPAAPGGPAWNPGTVSPYVGPVWPFVGPPAHHHHPAHARTPAVHSHAGSGKHHGHRGTPATPPPVIAPASPPPSAGLPSPGGGLPTAAGAPISRKVTITPTGSNGIFPVGPVIDATRMVGPQSETTINVNPANPNQLYVGANDLGLAFTGVPGQVASTSSDGGLTWTFNDVGTGTDGLPGSRGDPAAAWDSFGNLFISYIEQDATGAILPIDPILMSTDGGLTFKEVAALADPNAVLLDQESLAVGPGPGGQGQVLWIIATDFTLAGPFPQLVAALPIQGPGQVGALTTPQVIPGSDGNTFNSIAVGPDGQVAAVFETATGDSPGRLQVSVNPTGLGGTFGKPVVVAGLPTDFFLGTNKGGPPLPPAQPERGITMKGGIAYDNSNGPHRGRLYVIYTNTPATLNPASNIFLQFSDDGGQSFSAPLKVNDDTDTNSHFWPRVAVDPTTGYVAASWYDCRNSLGQGGPENPDGTVNTNPEFFAAVSFDGGATFQPNIKLEPAASSARANLLAAGDANNYGDYTGLDFRGGVFHAAWADNSDSLMGQNPEPATMDVATVAVHVPIALATTPVRDSDTSDDAVKFGALGTGSLEALLNQEIVNGSDGLPDYDWFRWSAGDAGMLKVTFSTLATTSALELHLFTLTPDNTLVELASTAAGGNTFNNAISLTAAVQKGEPILVEVKGFNFATGHFGTGTYDVEVGVT